MDESGQHISNYDHDVFKVRLDENGQESQAEKQASKDPVALFLPDLTQDDSLQN